MRTLLLRAVGFVLCATSLGSAAPLASAQDVIPLYQGTPPGSAAENYPEKEYFSKIWNTEVVTNVTKPTLTIFKPAPEQKNGTAIVVCPGGGFMALSITSEGGLVAKYLAAKGVTAFVLKYRLAHTGEDATEEFATLIGDRQKFNETVGKIIPLTIADGLAAVTYVRKHASEWSIAPDRVGIIGFSAGGTVAAGVAFHYAPEGRPAFVAPIYAAASRLKDSAVPADAPPMFIVAATDDNLGLAPDIKPLLFSVLALICFLNAQSSLAQQTPPQKEHLLFQKLDATIQSESRNLDGVLGVYVLDLTNGNTISLNADENFPTASTIKI